MGVKQELEITINADGGVRIHVQGAGGARCLELSKFLERSLGAVVKQEKTTEFYQEEAKPEIHRKQ